MRHGWRLREDGSQGVFKDRGKRKHRVVESGRTGCGERKDVKRCTGGQ